MTNYYGEGRLAWSSSGVFSYVRGTIRSIKQAGVVGTFSISVRVIFNLLQTIQCSYRFGEMNVPDFQCEFTERNIDIPERLYYLL